MRIKGTILVDISDKEAFDIAAKKVNDLLHRDTKEIPLSKDDVLKIVDNKWVKYVHDKQGFFSERIEIRPATELEVTLNIVRLELINSWTKA